MAIGEARIGIIGGSGLYTLLEGAKEISVHTPYGSPSDVIALGEIAGKKVAFLPRHGRRHQHPPHRIPYRANLWALKQIGVERVLAPCSVGSLQPDIKPGDIVICDQLVDRTKGRSDTFYDGPPVTHISLADPYCPELREILIKHATELGLTVHPTGTVVVVEGPRFSSRAESLWFKSLGWAVVNMTQYPEAALARELELCYCNISLVTDYDVWQPRPVSAEEVAKTLAENVKKVSRLLHATVSAVPEERRCACGRALKGAQIG